MLSLCAAACGAASAQIYGGASPEGTLTLSNFASERTPEVVIPGRSSSPEATPARSPAPVPLPRADRHRPPAVPADLTLAIDAAARHHGLDPTLLSAVIAVESGFDASALSPKGAMGLMQLMPATARRFGVRDAYSVSDNLRGGAAYLRWLLDYFDRDLALALAAYNAGEGAVLKAGRRIPPFPETMQYVDKVLAFVGRAGVDAR